MRWLIWYTIVISLLLLVLFYVPDLTPLVLVILIAENRRAIIRLRDKDKEINP